MHSKPDMDITDRSAIGVAHRERNRSKIGAITPENILSVYKIKGNRG